MEHPKYKVVLADHRFKSFEMEERALAQIGVPLTVGQCKTEDEIIELAHDADAIIISRAKITKRVIDSLERCKVIARPGVGVDTVDIAAATAKGIYVTNVPDANTDEVSNHAMALLLVWARSLLPAIEAAKAGDWTVERIPTPRRLKGQKLGIIGLGRIGRTVARKASGFDLVILGYDPYLTESQIKSAGALPADLDTLLRESDYVTIHCPLTDRTRGLLGVEELRKMKPNAVLINVARGPIVDREALLRALREGWIAGAGLDAFDQEPLPADDPILALPNVIATPHTAWYSDAARAEGRRKAAEEVVRILKGEQPLYLVNPEVLKAR